MASPVRRVGLVTALHKPRAVDSTRELAAALCDLGVEVLADERLVDLALPGCALAAPEAWGRETDLVIALGGDGTLLAAARVCAPSGTPLLGVDLGGFGFLAEQQFALVLEALPRLLQGGYALEERVMLRACLRSGATERVAFEGLNDAVIAKTEATRLVHLRTWLNEEFLTEYPADGLILATPTGSTAYSLSAGGPLVDPQVDCLILTPICPHTLSSRPLVVPGSAALRVQVHAGAHGTPPLALTVDGQRSAHLQEGEEVLVQVAPHRARLVRLGGTTFYGRLRAKLRWGEER